MRILRRFVNLVSALGIPSAMSVCFQAATGRRNIPVHVRGLRHRLWVRRRDSDLQVLMQLYAHHECDLQLNAPPRLIIDAGANVGYATALFANHYPNARIIAIEPDPDNCRQFRMNCAQLSNVELIEGALWPHEADLDLCNKSITRSWGLSVREPATGRGTVRGVTVPQILKRFPDQMIDLFKIDIEGAEQELFSEDAEAWIDRVRVIVIEVHGTQAQAAIDRALADRPFARSIQGERLILRREVAGDRDKA